MAVIQRISEQEYRDLALAEPRAELWNGEPREKPAMSIEQEGVAFFLGCLLQRQLDRTKCWISVNGGKACITGSTYFIPDVMVVQGELALPHRSDLRALAAWSEPLLLAVEVWSRSTGSNDVDHMLQAYRERRDREIRCIHPYDGPLTAWRLQPDGGYDQAFHAGGVVPCLSLPDVTIDPDELLA